MDYFNFNTQAIITAKQRADILKVLTRNFRMDMVLQNLIYGLFDGYYYFGIAQRTYSDNNISNDDKMLLNKIYTHILMETQE